MSSQETPSPMTGEQRLTAAMRGEPVDRVPIWLREGMAVGHAPAPADDFRNGWQAGPLYRDLLAEIEPHADVIGGWGLPGTNRMIMTDSSAITGRSEAVSDRVRRQTTTIRTPRGELVGVHESHRHEASGWCVKPVVTSRDELKMLQDVPWELNPGHIERAVEGYRRSKAAVGDRGIVRLGLSSPIVCISGCMPFEMFLELSLTEKRWFHELCAETTRRQLLMLDALFDTGVEFDSTANLGGSEQCTPPMMRPEAFDEYVVPYDGALVRRLKRGGIPVNMHCHGRVRHALTCMVAMGIDSSDPVEPPPAGDCTYAEAREIVGDRLTVAGNLEFDELEHAEPERIRRHVRDILALGNRRLILGASAGPITAITPRLAANFRAWVETALEYGA